MGRASKSKKKKAPKKTHRGRIDAEPIVMPEKPGNESTEKILIAYFDVSSLSDDERSALMLEIAAQSEASDDARDELSHPDVPSPTFALRTLRYEGTGKSRWCTSMREEDLSRPDDDDAPAHPKCPQCGNTDELVLVETYDARNPIGFDNEAGIPVVESVWHDASGNMGDGNGDYRAHCGKCGHESTDLKTFGLYSGKWDWR